MINKNKEYSFYAYLLFLIWPFVAFIVSFNNYKSKWAKNIIWLFVVFYGFTFVINPDGGGDSRKYRDRFLSYTENDYSFSEFAASLYSEANNIDILQDLINYLVSQFTANYHILFGVYGVIFGFFYSRNIWYLFEKITSKLKKANIVFILLFPLVVGFWEINGFRFWTATHLFLFGMLPYLYEKKYTYLFFSFVSIFVHFSFALPVAILFIYMLFGNKLVIYFYFLVVAFFFAEIETDIIRNNLFYLPEIFSDKAAGYLGEEYKTQIIERRSNYNWYALYYRKWFNWVMFVLAVVIYHKGKNVIKSNVYLLRLFSFSLLFFGFANFLTSIPSVGRFLSLAQLLMLATTILYVQTEQKLKTIKLATYISYPIIVLFVVMSIRLGFESISLFTIIGNPFIALFGENDISLISLFK